MTLHDDQHYLQRAVDLARDNVARGGRPFGAVLVRQGQVLAEAVNEIHLTQDPTAHAEMLAIRSASRQLGPRLEGCVIYASGQPCPMCLSAMYLSGVSRAVFAADNRLAEGFGLSTAGIYQQLSLAPEARQLPVEHLPHAAMATLYQAWQVQHEPG
jgi:guanine deaminase